QGEIVAHAGDPEATVFARSSLKPFQAAVSLRESGDGLPESELAVMAASHNGEQVHVDAVRSLLARAGLGEGSLLLPPAFPMDPSVPRGAEPAPILRDCSGKHAGMLFACARRGWDLATYLDPGHPLQRAVLAESEDVAGRVPIEVGVDGCGTPVPAFPLRAMARAFAVLEGDPHRALVAHAMRAEPYLVAGKDRVCTDLMTAVPGLVAKVGAEGLLCLAYPERGLGIAIKSSEGAVRPLGPAAVTVLARLGIVEQVPEDLVRWQRPPLLGGGDRVGWIEPALELTLA
ncbi:MAG TPA: asparaginase, partial [Actinomycetota bacterium]|nr:asparaginase [Actinomycetota bacterium]